MQEAENALERALRLAATHPEHRPEFCRILLESDVLVLGSTDAIGDGRGEIPAGAQVSIVNWEKPDGTPVTPFFSSVEALRRAIDEESRVLTLRARDLFELTRGATLFLNPRSSYGKEFFPQEIEALLATGISAVPSSRAVEKPTPVLLGQPAEYPSAMVSSLAALLAKHPQVKSAYLCLMHNSESQEPPALLVGIEGEGDLGAAMNEAGSVAADTSPEGVPVDIARIERGKEGLSAYFFTSGKPFYERSMATKLKSIFGR